MTKEKSNDDWAEPWIQRRQETSKVVMHSYYDMPYKLRYCIAVVELYHNRTLWYMFRLQLGKSSILVRNTWSSNSLDSAIALYMSELARVSNNGQLD